ncbi:tRNA pseudouridine synthase A [Planctomycetales bacterium 10988]|nr:tRNA pseudouridine synthase A [Planctomycetales bacterium 10988]
MNEERTYKMTLAYDGTDFAGWQVQPDQPTIQGALQAALKRITGEVRSVIGSGRTDAGVHAYGQVASFRSCTEIPTRRLHRALNAQTPETIQILELEQVDSEFHALASAKRKRYRYVIHDGSHPDVFHLRTSWHIHRRLDDTLIQQSAQLLTGTHDFSSFESQGAPRKTSIRTVYDFQITRAGDFVWFEVEANGFLYNMVRSLVGTIERVGRGKESIEWPFEVLQAKDRNVAGPTAPAQGLFLLWVHY